MHAGAEAHHGGERVHFGGRLQVHRHEAVFVLQSAHEVGAEQGVIDGEVADAGLQARGARQRVDERLTLNATDKTTGISVTDCTAGVATAEVVGALGWPTPDMSRS